MSIFNANILKKNSAEYFVISIATIIKLIFQFIATANSGYHCDELLHIEAGKHLAFGYMDFPPFIGLVACLQNLFHSDSLFVNHLFNYINSIAIIAICGLIVIKLGGKVLAVLITVLCLLFSPGFAASQYLFLPTAYEQLFWILIVYFTIEYCNTENSKFLNFIAVTAAVGFLTKYSIIFLLAGFVISILIFKKEIIRKKYTWIAVFMFALLISPNVIWQIRNDFPIFHHMSELYKTQLDKQSFLNEFITLVLFLNPFTFIVWFSAIIAVPFFNSLIKYRLAIFTLIFSFLFLVLSKGKSYYFFPIILGLIPFGSVFIEQILQKRKWILYIYLPLLSIFGFYILPHGLPLFKLEKYIDTYNLKPNKDNKIPLVFENYYSKENWNRILETVADIYNKLPEPEKKKCLIWGRHYSMSGGINLLGKKYHLPKAFSFHSSFYAWVPDFTKDITIIGISENNLDKKYWDRFFADVNEIKVIENHYAIQSNWYNYRIFVCKNAKYDSDELKKLFKNEIF